MAISSPGNHRAEQVGLDGVTRPTGDDADSTIVTGQAGDAQKRQT
ncbi:hypothetical protein [Nonomuraea maritima]|nr:hypothetical protein [Nonomuraea maritima]